MSNALPKFAAAAALAGALAAPADAALITLTVTGTYNGSTNVSDGTPGTAISSYAAIGSDISMIFHYDTASLDTDPSATMGRFGAPLTSSLIMDSLSLTKGNTGPYQGLISQQVSGSNNFFNVNAGGYSTGLPTGVSYVGASFSARDGADIGSLFDDVNILNTDLNRLSNADLFGMAISFTGNGQGPHGLFSEEANLSNIRYSFKEVADPPVGHIPEPSSLALAGLGAVALLAASRRRRENEAAPASAPATPANNG